MTSLKLLERWLFHASVLNCSFLYNFLIGNVFLVHQILKRDGQDIVSPSFQRFVHQEADNFIEKICDFTVFEGIHRTIEVLF
jgi:hypothetical protein